MARQRFDPRGVCGAWGERSVKAVDFTDAIEHVAGFAADIVSDIWGIVPSEPLNDAHGVGAVAVTHNRERVERPGRDLDSLDCPYAAGPKMERAARAFACI